MARSRAGSAPGSGGAGVVVPTLVAAVVGGSSLFALGVTAAHALQVDPVRPPSAARLGVPFADHPPASVSSGPPAVSSGPPAAASTAPEFSIAAPARLP